jgi:hypothetical protein
LGLERGDIDGSDDDGAVPHDGARVPDDDDDDGGGGGGGDGDDDPEGAAKNIGEVLCMYVGNEDDGADNECDELL